MVVGNVIEDKIVNQAYVTNPRIGLPYCCIITQLILVTGVSFIRYYEDTCYMGDIRWLTISRSSFQTLRDKEPFILEATMEQSLMLEPMME